MITSDGVLNLWEAIWKSAMRCELASCKKYIFDELSQHSIPDGHKIIKEMEDDILGAVRANILKEVRNYPNGYKRKYDYKELATKALGGKT